MFLIDPTKIVDVFCYIDDFCKEAKDFYHTHPLPEGLEKNKSTAGRKPSLSDSKVLTILVLYHLSGFKCFGYFYERLVLKELRSFFPKAVSYIQFLFPARQACFHIFLLAHYRCSFSSKTKHYYIDSKKLPVCDNRKIHSNRVFEEIATRGRGSTGWFYGLKLHLVTNQYGELIRFLLTPVNVADNNRQVPEYLFKGLAGKCYGDQGYLTAMPEELPEKGIHLITKARKKKKNRLFTLQDKLNLLKRGSIEAVNDILMSVFDIDHTRHRNPLNALVQIFSGLVTYTFPGHEQTKFNPASLAA